MNLDVNICMYVCVGVNAYDSVDDDVNVDDNMYGDVDVGDIVDSGVGDNGDNKKNMRRSFERWCCCVCVFFFCFVMLKCM